MKHWADGGASGSKVSYLRDSRTGAYHVMVMQRCSGTYYVGFSGNSPDIDEVPTLEEAKALAELVIAGGENV